MAPPTSITTSPAWWRRASSPSYRQPQFLRSATSIQTMSQIFLVLQNSTLITLIKLVVSLAIACHAQAKATRATTGPGAPPAKHAPRPLRLTRPADLATMVYQSLFSSGSWMLILPAGLYALQTHLVYVAVSNMETVPFQVTYQLKILTTVLFSIVMLQRVITPRQWIALVLLTLGVAVVQVAESSTTTTKTAAAVAVATSSSSPISLAALRGWFTHVGQNSTQTTAASTTTATTLGVHTVRIGINTSKGFVAAIAASLISGFTGVYFEKLIKESRVSVSLWTRNAQLSFFSLFPITILGVFWKDGSAIAEHGFFVGYGPTVWATIGLQALGGILVAICITYSDNVAKNLAASFSIVVSYIVNSVLFDEPMTLNSTIGISTVLFSLYLYQSRSNRPPNAPLLPIGKDGVDVWSKELHEK